MQWPTQLLLLAAGAGRRFDGGEHKLRAVVRGRPLAAWTLEAALESHAGPLVVVTGSITIEIPDDLSASARDSIGAFGVPRFVHNPQWAVGMATSLQVGLAAVDGAQGVVVGLADQPCVSPSAWRNVAASTSPLAVATYGSRRGNPVRLHAEMWAHVPREGDEGARSLLLAHPELVEEVACEGSALDVDTREDLALVEACLASRERNR